MSADDDLVSEIIKYKRNSLETVNCTGLDQHLLDPSCSTIKNRVILPLMADVEAARIKAQHLYTKWMAYMTGIVWGSDSSSFFLCYPS